MAKALYIRQPQDYLQYDYICRSTYCSHALASFCETTHIRLESVYMNRRNYIISIANLLRFLLFFVTMDLTPPSAFASSVCLTVLLLFLRLVFLFAAAIARTLCIFVSVCIKGGLGFSLRFSRLRHFFYFFLETWIFTYFFAAKPIKSQEEHGWYLH